MQHLNTRERELVAIGAALGSNCIPCTESHIAKAKQAGLSDVEIRVAIHLADEVRKAPAAKVLETALDALRDSQPAGPCCHS